MEKKPAGAKKIGKKTSKHLPCLFFDASSLYSYPPSRKTSVQRAHADAVADQAGTPAKLSK